MWKGNEKPAAPLNRITCLDNLSAIASNRKEFQSSNEKHQNPKFKENLTSNHSMQVLEPPVVDNVAIWLAIMRLEEI